MFSTYMLFGSHFLNCFTSLIGRQMLDCYYEKSPLKFSPKNCLMINPPSVLLPEVTIYTQTCLESI